MDLVFLNIRVGLFFMDHEIIKTNIAKAHQMLEQGGDWDRRNRLKVYEGLYAMAIRDFSAAAKLFLDAVSTFTRWVCWDLTYEQVISIDLFQLRADGLHQVCRVRRLDLSPGAGPE